MDRPMIARVAVGLALLALLSWLAWPTPPTPPAPRPTRPEPAPPPVAAAPPPPVPTGPEPTADPVLDALAALAELEGAVTVVCPLDEPFGRHPFLRAHRVEGSLVGLAADPAGRGWVYPPPPDPRSFAPGALGPALLAAREPLAVLAWSAEGCEVLPVPTIVLAGRVEGAPGGGSWLVGCGLLRAPTDDDGAFEVDVPGGAPCSLQVEGRGPHHTLSGDADALDLRLPWPDDGPDDDPVAAHARALRAELDALAASPDPLEAALDQELDPAVRAVLEDWLADELALRAQRQALLATLPRGPVREATDLEDLEAFPTPP